MGFSSANAGWSGEERDTELYLEANLVDPSVSRELKNICLIHFHDALVPLLIQDHRLSPPPTTRLLMLFSPPTPKTDDQTCTRISRRELGRCIMLNAPHYGLWKELRLDAMHATLDHARATIKTALQDEAWRLRSTASVETLQAEMRMLRKQNEARAREIRKRKERIKELEAAPDNQEDAVQELTSEIDGENDGETYRTKRNDEEIYR